jgi:hypothetical protein
MARRLIVEIIGDASSLERSFGKASKSAKEFDRDIGHVFRGVASGSGLFEHLGRSLAFASGGFLAFAGAGEALRSIVDAGTEAAQSQRQLAAQLKVTGLSYEENRAQIEETTTKLASLSGFTRDELTQSFTTLLRSTRAVRPALQDMAVAADIARGRHISLATASIAVGRAAAGSVTSLQRLGIVLPKGTTGLQGIAIAAQRYRGQAEAGATAQQKFASALHSTEEIIGAALLPTINKYLGKLTDWLTRMDTSGKLQDRVRSAVEKLGHAISAVSGFIKTVVGDLGGWQNALGILVGAFVGFKAAGIASAIAVSTANVIAAGITEKAWQAALISTGWGLFAVAAGVAAEQIIQHWGAVKQWFGDFWTWMQETEDKALLKIVGAFAWIPRKLGGGVFKDAQAALKADLQDLEAQAAQSAQGVGNALGKVKTAVADAAPAVPALAAPTGPAGLSANQRASRRYQWFDAMINRDVSRVQDIPTLQGQIGRLREISGLIQKRLDVTNDVTRRLTLKDQLLSVARTIRSDQTQIAQNAAQAAQAQQQAAQKAQQDLFAGLQFNVDKAGLTKSLQDDLAALHKYQAVVQEIIRTQGSTLDLQKTLLGVEQNIAGVQDQIASNRRQAADKARQAAGAARDALQFRMLGLGPTGGALVPGVENLRKRLTSIKDAVQGTFLDTGKTGAELTRIGNILAGKFGSVSEQVRSAIDQMFTSIRDKLSGSIGTQTKFQHLSSQKFVESLGLNLTPEQKRAIEARFSTIGAGGTAPRATGQFAAAGGVTITGPVHVHGVQDIGQFENAITKRAKARPHTRRGA